jgi:DNA (cytosine-5)-methyltransferase 1
MLGDVDVTAVEIDQSIADFYSSENPNDRVWVGDAHDYLLNHYKEFDFIWSSPPCQSHSRARFWNRKLTPVYPDMSLYQEIIFLKNFFKGKWAVENVKPYYDLLIQPAVSLGRHVFWANYHISGVEVISPDVVSGDVEGWQEANGVDISGHKFSGRRDQVLRNCVHPEIGLHVFESSKTSSPKTNKQMSLSWDR